MNTAPTAPRGLNKIHTSFRRVGICAFISLLLGASALAQVASSTLAGLASAAGQTDSPPRFNYPQRIAVGPGGFVYVADSGNHTIRKVSPTGVTTTLAGLAGTMGASDGTGNTALFRGPQGIAVDSAGNVYVADTYNHAIRKVTAAGVVSLVAGTMTLSGNVDGTGAAARFNSPDGIAIDSTGTILYVADMGNALIRKVVIASGVVSTVAGTAGSNGYLDGTGTAAKFNRPASVAVDSTGANLYVADVYNHVIRQIVLATGAVSTFAGTAGSSGTVDGTGAAARFNFPGGVAIDSTGNIVVSDSLNHAIRKITPAGVVSLYAGQPLVLGSADGFTSNIRFNAPQGVACDAAGYTYVADTSNHTVRKLGTVSAPTATISANQTVGVGQAATFTATASGFPIPTYQWQRQAAGTSGFYNLSNDTVYSGVSTATLTIASASTTMTGDQFQCVVSNGYSAPGASPAATLTVQTAPTITSASSASFVVNSATNSFNVTATGGPAPTFSLTGAPGWLSLAAPTTVSGITTAVLSGTPTSTVGSPFTFSITASNGVGTNAVQSFTLTVLPTQGLPVVSVPPANATVSPGQTATFNITAVANPSATYRWQRAIASSPSVFSDIYDGGYYSGATTATLSVYSTTTTMSGDLFRCVVSNAYGATISTSATLTVLYPPTITSATTTTFVVGAANSFTVVATGGPAPTFALIGNPGFVSIDPTTGILSGIPSSTTSSPFYFTISATNTQGTVTQAFVLNVLPTLGAPVVTTQPTNQTLAYIGQSVVFTTAAAGNPSPSYIWQYKPANSTYFVSLTEGGNYTGVNTATLTINGTTAAMNGDEFQCLVSNAYGTVATTAAKLIVPIAPTITSTNTATFVVGAANSFTVTGTGGPTPTYSLVGVTPSGWFNFDSTTGVMSGIPTNTVGAPFVFTVMASNGVAPVATQSFTLNVIPAPTIPVVTTQPVSASLGIGESVTFTITASGSPLPTYQWQRIQAGTSYVTNIVDDSIFSGATTNSLTVKNITTGMSGDQYVCVVSNSAGTVSSTAATLTVSTASVFGTFAGIAGAPGYVDAMGTTARFYSPSAIAIDVSGNIYVADTLNSVIRKITTDGVVTTLAGTAGMRGSDDGIGSLARFNGPAGIAVDNAGVVYVADTSNHIIRRIAASGAVTTLAGTASVAGSADGIQGSARFSFPYGIVVDSVGNLYVADSFNNTIRQVTSSGIVSTIAGSAGVRGTTDGVGTAARFSFPYGLAIDNLNNVYIADSLNHTIRKMTMAGVVTTVAGVPGVSGSVDGVVTTARFNQPGGVAIDASGTIYVADSYNNTIRKITGGNVTTIAGLAGAAGKADGAGSTARFDHPFAIAYKSDGTIYIADTYNHTIRKSGSVTAPTITTQPISVSTGPDKTATFTISASGTPTPWYQWYRKAVGAESFVPLTEISPYSGVTSAVLTVSPTTVAMSGDQFMCTAVNGVSPEASSAAVTLTIGTAPVITEQPVPTTATVGTSVSLSVTATGLTTQTYQWRKNGVDISGATSATLAFSSVQQSDAGQYTVTVTNSLGSVTSSSVALTVNPPTAPTFTQLIRDQVAEFGGTITLVAPATGSPAPTYQWRKNGVPISGATGAILEIKNVQAGDSGSYDVVVTNMAGTATSNAAVVTVVNRSFAGTYFGTFGAGNGVFAILVRNDNSAVLLGYVTSNGLVIRNASVKVDDLGVFTISQTTAASDIDPRAAAEQITLTGVITTGGTVSGSISGVSGTTMSGSRSNPSGPTQNYAGYYQTTAANSSAGTVMIVGSAGQAFVMTQSSTLSDAGVGSVDSSGRVSVTTSKQTTVSATVTADATKVSATVVDNKGTVTSYVGGSESVVKAQRLANISTRAQVSSGDSVAIAGFVIQGTEAKQVLIRAVGPTLATFGVGNTLANPKLELRSASGSVIATNVGWTTAGNAASITSVGAQLGAFTMTNNGDSAILTTLGPGSYTAIVSSATSLQGVALIEVYDATPVANQKLVNISTRAVVGTGENALIAGVVVSGTMPKRVLIRAVGPSLSQFGLTNLLANPQLTVYKGSQVVAQNAGWTVSPDASAIADATTQVQAFSLLPGRTDAALILNLEPGVYSAQVTGLNSGTGNCIVEVYEIP